MRYMLPVIVPTGTDFGHAVLVGRMIRMSGVASVVEGATSGGVDGDEEDEDQNVDHRQFSPVKTNLLENTSLARIALVA